MLTPNLCASSLSCCHGAPLLFVFDAVLICNRLRPLQSGLLLNSFFPLAAAVGLCWWMWPATKWKDGTNGICKMGKNLTCMAISVCKWHRQDVTIKASPRRWMPNTHFKQEENSCLTPQPFVRGRCGLVGASNSFGHQLWVRVTLWLKASWFGVVLILAFEAKDQSFLHSFLFSWSEGRRGIGKQKHNSTG